MPLHCLETLSPVSLAIPSAPTLLLFQSLTFFSVFTQMSPQWGLSLIILNATASQYPRFCFIFILLTGGVGGGLGANSSLLLNSKRVCCWLLLFAFILCWVYSWVTSFYFFSFFCATSILGTIRSCSLRISSDEWQRRLMYGWIQPWAL